MHYSVRCGHRGLRLMPIVALLCLCYVYVSSWCCLCNGNWLTSDRVNKNKYKIHTKNTNSATESVLSSNNSWKKLSYRWQTARRVYRSVKVIESGTFDRLCMVSYYCPMATLSILARFDFRNAVTLKAELWVREGHWKCHHSIESLWLSIDDL